MTRIRAHSVTVARTQSPTKVGAQCVTRIGVQSMAGFKAKSVTKGRVWSRVGNWYPCAKPLSQFRCPS